MSRYGDWDDQRTDRDSFEEDLENLSLQRAGTAPSGAVTALGIVTIIVGSLGLLMGGCFLIVGMIGATMDEQQMPNDEKVGIVVILALITVIVFWSVGLLVCGIGLLARSAWARTLTLVLSGFGLLFGMICVGGTVVVLAAAERQEGRIAGAAIFLVLAFLFLGHGLWAFIVLLGKRAASEFR